MGRELRRLRANAGLQQAEAARLAETSPQSIGRIEDGQYTRITSFQINALCNACGATDAERRAVLDLLEDVRAARKSKAEGGWWRAYSDQISMRFDHYLALERAADRLIAWNVTTVPGPLQTAEYRRALAWAESPDTPSSEIERRIEWAAMRKKELLDKGQREPLQINAILFEAVLRNQIGGPAVMRGELEHLLNMSERPNVSLRVVSFARTSYLGSLSGSFLFLEFPPLSQSKLVEPPVVYVEQYVGDLFLSDEPDLGKYRHALSEITRVALDDDESRALVQEIAEEYNP